MTRTQLITRAATRIGDASAAFLIIMDALFDDVMQDLAADELLPALNVTNTFDTVQDQESYVTQTMTGLSEEPLKILEIRVPTWGATGKIKQAESDLEWNAFRQPMADLRGRFRLWRIYPNISQVQFWPPVDSENADTGIGEIRFLKPPTAIAGGATITEAPSPDFGTLQWGLIMLAAPFRDDNLIDVDRATQHYELGKREMRGRLHTQGVTRAYPRDF